MIHEEGAAEIVSEASNRASLMKSLELACINKDILADVADACEINEYTTMRLADPDLDPSVVAADIYVTVEEAKHIQEYCRQQLAEAAVVTAEEGSVAPGDRAEEAENNDGGEEEGEEDAAPAGPPPDDTAGEERPEEDHPGLDESYVSSHALPEDANSDDSLVVAELETEAPLTPENTEDCPTEVPDVKKILFQEPAMQDKSSLPSYLRPTASAREKAKKANAAEDVSKKSLRPASASTRIRSSLLQPTKASQNRATKKHEPTPRMAQSTNLDAHMRPAMNRTTPRPFKLSTESRVGQHQVLSTDEVRIMRAKKEMQHLKHMSEKSLWKTSPAPQSRPASDVRASTQFKPFSLTSSELHAKAQEMLEQQKKQEEEKERQARKFKARPVTYDKARTYTDIVAEVDNNIAQQKKFTRAVEPVLQSLQRSQIHKALEEEKKARDAEAAATLAAEQKLQDEKEAMEIKEMRKNLQFHAQAMPKFDSPFRPDPTLSTPPTKGKAPTFEMDKRIACRGSTEKAEADPDLEVRSATALNLFASSLRSSIMSPKENLVKTHYKSSESMPPAMFAGQPLSPAKSNTPNKNGAVIKLNVTAV